MYKVIINIHLVERIIQGLQYDYDVLKVTQLSGNLAAIIYTPKCAYDRIYTLVSNVLYERAHKEIITPLINVQR